MRNPFQWLREQVEAAEPRIVETPAELGPGHDGPDPDGPAVVVGVDGDTVIVAERRPDGLVELSPHAAPVLEAPLYQVRSGELDTTETLKTTNQRLRRHLADAEARARRFEAFYLAAADERDRWRIKAVTLLAKQAAYEHPPTVFVARDQDGPDAWFELGKLASPMTFTATNGSTTSGGRTSADGPDGGRPALGALPGPAGAEELARGPVPGQPPRLEP